MLTSASSWPGSPAGTPTTASSSIRRSSFSSLWKITEMPRSDPEGAPADRCLPPRARGLAHPLGHRLPQVHRSEDPASHRFGRSQRCHDLIVKELLPTDAYLRELVAWLTRWDTDYRKFIDPKIQLLIALEDHRDATI